MGGGAEPVVKEKDKGSKAELPNQGERSALRAMGIRAGLGGRGVGPGRGVVPGGVPGLRPRLLKLLGQRGDVLHAVLVGRQVAFEGLVAPQQRPHLL